MDSEHTYFSKVAFIASETTDAEHALESLSKRYGNASFADADVIVALGGDGLMLQTLHRFMNTRIPIYGMNCGSVGFLMNEYEEDNLLERLQSAERNVIYPLRMTARNKAEKNFEALAINEVSLFRQTYQAAKLRIRVDGKTRMNELICDGAMVSTPAGSTAYNLSAYGTILPIHAPLLALTPISPFRPRRWRGAILNNTAQVQFDILEAEKRPVSVVADHKEFRFINTVTIEEARDIQLVMLFDPGHALEERILTEQFLN
ncbi:MAG: NAD kinase [Pseudomonadota bacterium]